MADEPSPDLPDVEVLELPPYVEHARRKLNEVGETLPIGGRPPDPEASHTLRDIVYLTPRSSG